MKFSLWRQYGSLNSTPVWDAFEQGARALGHKVAYNQTGADVDVIWSVLWSGRMTQNREVWQRCKNSNTPIIVLEVGAIQRGTTWRVGLGGVNRDAYFSPSGNTDSRARQFRLDLKPWRTQGAHILICGQHEKSQQWHDLPAPARWLDECVKKIRKQSVRPIVFRPHPRAAPIKLPRDSGVTLQQPRKRRGTYDDYDMRFSGAWAVVSETSNPGPQAVINGVPAFVGPSSLAYGVANTDLANIENPCMPQRQQWLNDYAYTEHTIAEIQQGIPLSYLTQVIE